MVISITPRSNTASQTPEVSRARIPGEYGDFDSLRLKLSQLLQTSLILDDIIRLFYTYVQEAVVVDGIIYQNNLNNCQSEIGQLGKHRASYQLTNANEDCGEIILTRNQRFSEDELLAIELLLPNLMFPVRNAMLYRQAMHSATTDQLTGISNRFSFDSSFSREVDLANRYQCDLTLVIVDIDHFKKVNDVYGHITGDHILAEVAKTLNSVIRNCDACFRYGGEEFVVLLPNTNMADATNIAERQRKFIEQQVHHTPKGDIRVSASFGIAQLTQGETSQQLFEKADRALYQAKEAGRNRIESVD